MKLIDLKKLINLLGAEGAVAGIVHSDISDTDLVRLGDRLSIESMSSRNRGAIVGAIVAKAAQNIEKTLSDLKSMSAKDIKAYFDQVGATDPELIKLLDEMGYSVGSEDRKNLKKFVATQISETALFSSIANGRRPEDIKG